MTRSVKAIDAALAVTAVALLGLGALSLTVKLWRLVGDPGPQGAIDLKYLYEFTNSWFSGVPIYQREPNAGVTYPPASFAILWPTYGWLSMAQSRWVWGVLDLAALATLSGLFWRALRAAGRPAQLCAALAPFSMPPLADAFGIGQTTIVVMALAVGAVLLAVRPKPSWLRDFAAAGLFACALVKLSVAAPFFLALLIVPGRLRVSMLTVAVYALLTLVAIQFQAASPPDLIRGWLTQARGNSGMGYGNIQDWLFRLGWSDAFPVLALTLLAGLAAVTWWCRRADVWLLLGLAAVVARLWTYHRVYDDAVMIIALVATGRLASGPHGPRWLVLSARMMLVVSAIILWIPLQFHYVYSTFGPLQVVPSWVVMFNAAHSMVFVGSLILLTAGALVLRSPQSAVSPEREGLARAPEPQPRPS
jgi:hypothetical protein